MATLAEQITGLLAPCERLLSVALMRRADEVTGPSGTLAERLGHTGGMHAAVTSQRLAFFAHHPVRRNAIGAPIVGYLPSHVRDCAVSGPVGTDPLLAVEFVDGSSALIAWRRREEITEWMTALEAMRSTWAAATADPGADEPERQ